MKVPLRPLLTLLAIVLGFSVGMATLLNYFKFESTLRKHEGARFGLVADDVQNNIQSSLSLGLAFGEIGTLQDLLDRHRNSDRLILSLHVFDAAGRIRYSTHPEYTGQTTPIGWTTALRRPNWLLSEPEGMVAGRTVRNAFDVVVGGVGVRYDRTQSDATISEIGRRLLGLAFAIVAVLVLAGAAPLALLARATERTLDRAADALLESYPAATERASIAEVLAFRDSTDRAERELSTAVRRLAPEAARDHA